jgi:hypothetical protein
MSPATDLSQTHLAVAGMVHVRTLKNNLVSYLTNNLFIYSVKSRLSFCTA